MKQINNRRSLSLVSALLVLAVFAVGVLGCCWAAPRPTGG